MNKLLTDDETKWKPRNKQAAFIVRPASWMNQPPIEPRYAPSPIELAAMQLKEIQAARAIADAMAEAQLKRIARRGNQKPQPKVAKCKYAIKELRNIHRRKGLPPPTWDEIREYQKSRPLYGQVIAHP